MCVALVIAKRFTIQNGTTIPQDNRDMSAIIKSNRNLEFIPIFRIVVKYLHKWQTWVTPHTDLLLMDTHVICITLYMHIHHPTSAKDRPTNQPTKNNNKHPAKTLRATIDNVANFLLLMLFVVACCSCN